MVNNKFIYPDKDIIMKSNATTNSYTHPIIGKVFWNRYETVFKYLNKDLFDRDISKYQCILEVGTSYGFFLPSLCQISHHVVGSDIEGTLNFCKDKTLDLIKNKYENLSLKSADVRNLNESFDDESFDVILAFSVFEHIDEFEIGLKNVYKCLKSDGIFICELPSENKLYKLGRNFAGYQDAHPNYNHNKLVKYIEKIFQKKTNINSPYGLPLFKIGIYTK